MMPTVVDADLVEILEALPSHVLVAVGNELAQLADAVENDATRTVLDHVVRLADALADSRADVYMDGDDE
ncbi:MAG: hypothetical protein ABI808_11215 [Pseudonocardiales bacterium]